MINPMKVKVKIRKDGYFLSVTTKKSRYGQFYKKGKISDTSEAILRFMAFYNKFE